MSRVIHLCLLCLFLMCSCIREDRSVCPCFLHVDMTDIDTTAIRRMDLMLFQDGVLSGTHTAEPAVFGEELIIPVSRNELQFCAWGNVENSRLDTVRQTINLHGGCDSVWFFSKTVRTDCEDAYIRVVPERQFKSVVIVVRGQISGISEVHTLITGIDNTFSFVGDVPAGNPGQIVPQLVKSPSSGEEYYQFQTLITKQAGAADAILRLEFISEGKLRKGTYELGRLLLEAGEDLSISGGRPIVIDIVLGAASAFISISTEEWVGHDTFEITL